MIRKNFVKHVLWAMLLGCLFGLLAHEMRAHEYPQLNAIIHGLQIHLLNPIGLIFIRLLMLLIVPVIFCSLINGTAKLDNMKQLGNLGLKTLLLYLCTTAIAVFLALCISHIIQPGISSTIPPMQTTDDSLMLLSSQKPLDSVLDIVKQMIPVNIVQAASNGNVLQIILFSILFGLAILKCGSSVNGLKKRLEELNDVVMSLVSIILTITPIGVFCLISQHVNQMGFDLITALMGYFLTVIFVLFVHFIVVYGLMISCFTPFSFVDFLKKIAEAIVFAFSVSSSAASIPVVIKTVQERLNVDKTISSFVIPLGATINMDGTAIMQGVATVFVAHLYHIPLTLTHYMIVIAMATAASIGTAAVPSAGIIMLIVVFKQIGLPIDGIAMILGVDRLLDMLRTAVNITGDCTIATVLQHHNKS